MPKFSANLTFLYADLPLLDRFAAAAKSGFKGVEYMSPYEETKSDLVARLRDNGLTQALHNLPAGNWAAGERGIAIFPDRVEEFRRGVHQAIDYASALGCGLVNCIAGVAPKGADVKTLHKTLVANLSYAAAEMAKAKIKLRPAH
jgi:hydroxypyruvate isomerase